MMVIVMVLLVLYVHVDGARSLSWRGCWRRWHQADILSVQQVSMTSRKVINKHEVAARWCSHAAGRFCHWW